MVILLVRAMLRMRRCRQASTGQHDSCAYTDYVRSAHRDGADSRHAHAMQAACSNGSQWPPPSRNCSSRGGCTRTSTPPPPRCSSSRRYPWIPRLQHQLLPGRRRHQHLDGAADGADLLHLGVRELQHRQGAERLLRAAAAARYRHDGRVRRRSTFSCSTFSGK